jgi:hypothetical protein
LNEVRKPYAKVVFTRNFPAELKRARSPSVPLSIVKKRMAPLRVVPFPVYVPTIEATSFPPPNVPLNLALKAIVPQVASVAEFEPPPLLPKDNCPVPLLPVTETVEVVPGINETPSVFDEEFKYVRAMDTDISRTWRKMGWLPPSEYRTDYLFATNREEKGV